MRALLERWLTARWYGRPGWLLCLWPLELLYRGILALRAGVTSARPAVPVIVVGNLAVGGSGKTPLVLALVAAARTRGLRVAVIARGHGGAGPFPLPVTPDTAAAACGDEPLLLARRFPDLPVFVAPRRADALARAVEQGVDLVISDDGLQHRALPRTLEIAVIDGRRGLGNGHCLPVGPLRESPARLATVDFVVVNGKPSMPLPRTADAGFQLRSQAFRRVADPVTALSVDDFVARHASASLAALAGIGDPARFFATLRELGLARIEEHAFADHHAFVAADLAPFAGRTLLMTEKDAVKCGALVAAAGIDAWFLAVDADLPADFPDRLFVRAGLAERGAA